MKLPQDNRERAFSGKPEPVNRVGWAGIQMNKRFVGVLTFAFLVAAGASLVLYRVLINRPQNAKAAPAMVDPTITPKGWTVPKTAFGQPDLSGYWSNATMTPILPRPSATELCI